VPRVIPLRLKGTLYRAPESNHSKREAEADCCRASDNHENECQGSHLLPPEPYGLERENGGQLLRGPSDPRKGAGYVPPGDEACRVAGASMRIANAAPTGESDKSTGQPRGDRGWPTRV